MLSEKNAPASHVGEEQSSPDVFAPRTAVWANNLLSLLGAAKTVANNYLQAERGDPAACLDADHHKAVVDLFNQIEHADAMGLSLGGALQLAVNGQASAPLWFAKSDRFAAATKPALIAANGWLRSGDVVFQAQNVLRHTLTEDDIKDARPAVTGGAA